MAGSLQKESLRNNNMTDISPTYHHLDTWSGYNPLKFVDPTGERQMGWSPSTYYYEQMARLVVLKEQYRVYEVAMASHWLLMDYISNCVFSQGPNAMGCGGSGNHGSGGGSVEVQSIGDGKYKVINGLYDGGNTVYVVDDQGNRTGEVLGRTLTPCTFYNEDGRLKKGITIDLNDFSGQVFWNDFITNTPSLTIYALDMYDGYKNDDYNSIYDFKKHDKDAYRGMPIDFGFGRYICTARDIGNFAAGYLCGINALTYNDTRVVFDLFHMCTNNSIRGEPPVSRLAQDIGYYWGAYNFYIKLFKKH